jgi:phage terminase large subunit-like protein
MLELGFKGRRSPLLMMITNSGFDKKSACWEEHNHAAKVAAGEVMDDKTFSFICSLDKGDDPINDSKCWIKANPLLGVVVKDNVLKEAVKQAIQIPGKKNNIMRLHFCEWTDAETSWISSETWTECEHELDIDDFISKPCYGGLDLSSKLDLTALARVFENDDGMLNAFVDFWKPKDTLYDTEIKDRAPYTTWLNQGYLHAPAGSSIDYEVVASDIIAMGDFEQINFDRWRIDFFKKHLSDIGYELPLEPFGQGFKDMSPAIEKLEELIFNKKIKIHINPVLRWNAASVKIEEDAAGNRKMSKIKSTGRIDGIIALLMAIAAYNANNKNITVELNIRQL